MGPPPKFYGARDILAPTGGALLPEFRENDFETATSCFADDCVTVTPAGTFNIVERKAFGRAFKNGLPDAHMELVRAVETGTRSTSPGGSKVRTSRTW